MAAFFLFNTRLQGQWMVERGQMGEKTGWKNEKKILRLLRAKYISTAISNFHAPDDVLELSSSWRTVNRETGYHCWWKSLTKAHPGRRVSWAFLQISTYLEWCPSQWSTTKLLLSPLLLAYPNAMDWLNSAPALSSIVAVSAFYRYVRSNALTTLLILGTALLAIPS